MRPSAVCTRVGSAAICAVASRTAFALPSARSARWARDAWTAAAACLMRADSTAGSASAGIFSSAEGAATGGAIVRTRPITRPALTATPEYSDICVHPSGTSPGAGGSRGRGSWSGRSPGRRPVRPSYGRALRTHPGRSACGIGGPGARHIDAPGQRTANDHRLDGADRAFATGVTPPRDTGDVSGSDGREARGAAIPIMASEHACPRPAMGPGTPPRSRRHAGDGPSRGWVRSVLAASTPGSPRAAAPGPDAPQR